MGRSKEGHNTDKYDCAVETTMTQKETTKNKHEVDKQLREAKKDMVPKQLARDLAPGNSQRHSKKWIAEVLSAWEFTAS